VIDRQERANANEEYFRTLNGIVLQLEAHTSRPQIVCECADTECMTRIEIEASAYERVRETEDRFVIAPGHEMLEFERVVERSGGYYVVEKFES